MSSNVGATSPGNYSVAPNQVDLSVSIPAPRGPLVLSHPIIPASGTFGYAEEFEPFVAPGAYAAVLGKSISIEPRPGNAPPRTQEMPAGLLNSIGLQNPGIDRFLDSYMPRLANYGVPVIVNIVGKTTEDYAQLVERLDKVPTVSAIELNVSCPNVKEGLQFGLEPEASRNLVATVRALTDLPLIAKLTPNVTDIAEQGLAVQEGGANAVSLINTVRAMAIDWRSRRSRIGTPTGGLSGPAIRPIAVRMVYEVARAVSIPVCGIGGIATPQDVLEFAVAGASFVQVGTHLYREPSCVVEWVDELRILLASAGLDSLQSLVGSFAE